MITMNKMYFNQRQTSLVYLYKEGIVVLPSVSNRSSSRSSSSSKIFRSKQDNQRENEKNSFPHFS